VGEVRRHVAVADDEVVRGDRLLENGPRVKAVARVEKPGELGVDLVHGAEDAVEVVADRDAERVVVVEREAEQAGRQALALRRLDEQPGLGSLPRPVDPLDRDECSRHRI